MPGTAEAFNRLTLTQAPTVVTRTAGTPLVGAGTSQSILRYFNILPATNSDLRVTINFAYLESIKKCGAMGDNHLA